MIVATVLKSGGVYDWEYVRRIRESIPSKYEFVCLSDLDLPCDTIKLKNNWEGWWAKIELFRLKGKIFYLDLDTVITADISHIIDYPHKFTMLRDLGRAYTPASGIMAWEGDYSFIYKEFKYGTSYPGHGDQGYIASKIKNPQFFQDIFPGEIASYKLQDSSKAKIVCYHGSPKPHETGWANSKISS